MSTAVRWALAGLLLAVAPAAPLGAASASKLPAQPALYVVTGGQEGLYAWPRFPATIHLNSDTYLTGLHWARASVALVVATGTLRQSTCKNSCAGGPWVSSPVHLDASAPASCPVEATRALRYETYAFYERDLVYSKVVYVPEGGAPAGGHQFLLSPPCPSGPLPTTEWPPVKWGPGAGTGPLRWTAPEHVTADHGSALVACASTASCVVVGGNPDVPGTHGQVVNESTEWDGHAWSKPVELGVNGTTVTALACTAPASCLAVDDAGQAISSDGTAWSAPKQLAPGPLESVSCPTAGFCMAVGVVAVAYRQGRWLGPQPVDSEGGPTSVSCASASFCVAVDPGGHVVTYSGGTWSPPRLVAAGAGGLWSVSCPSERSCLAVDLSGRVLAWGGAGWSRPEYIGVGTGGIDVYAASPLTCASPQFCVLVDAAGNAFTYNGRSWSAPAHIDPRGGLSSVSCPSPRFCMAVDDFGDVVIGRGPGTAIGSPATPVKPATSQEAEK